MGKPVRIDLELAPLNGVEGDRTEEQIGLEVEAQVGEFLFEVDDEDGDALTLGVVADSVRVEFP